MQEWLSLINLHLCSITTHSLSEWGFQVPKRHQAPAHIWDLPRWWKSLLWMYKIFDMRTFGLSHQIKGPTTVKLAFLQLIQLEPVLATFTVVGPLIWCDNPKVRMSKILYINNNNFHHLGRSQMCAGGCYVFRTSKPHSGTLWHDMIISKTKRCFSTPYKWANACAKF